MKAPRNGEENTDVFYAVELRFPMSVELAQFLAGFFFLAIWAMIGQFAASQP